MLERFKNIFEGLDYAHGAFVKQVTSLPEAKTQGKSFVIKTAVVDSIWQKHLDGVEPRLGIFPVTAKNLCKWACIDIDIYTYDYETLLKKIIDKKLPLIMFRSKSGGAHIFLFSIKFVPAEQMQYAINKCAAILGVKDIMDCVYPKQTKILAERGDVGNYLNLPYFNTRHASCYAYKEDFTKASIQEFFEMYDKVALKDIETFINEPPPLPSKIKSKNLKDSNPYLEAPPCLLALIEEKIKKGERDDALLNFGIFYKKSHEAFLDKDGRPHTWENLLVEANRRYFEPPLTHDDVNKIIKTLQKDYKYTCQKPVIKRVCNPKLCITRKYGIGSGEQVSEAKDVLGDITEYTSRPPRFFLDVQPADLEKSRVRVEVDFNTLRKKDPFYDAVGNQASVWLPDMKSHLYNELMKEKFDERSFEEAPDEADETYEFKELFNEFLEAVNAYDQRKFLLDNVNYFDPETNALEFNLNVFSKFLKAREYKISRPALCTKIKHVLKAEKKKGSATSDKQEKISVVTWRIEKYDLKPNQKTIEGEIADDVKRIKLDG